MSGEGPLYCFPTPPNPTLRHRPPDLRRARCDNAASDRSDRASPGRLCRALLLYLTMTLFGLAQMLVWLALLLVMVRPLGGYMQRVFPGEATPLSTLCRPIETALYRLAGVRPDEEQSWYQYALAFLVFHLPGLSLLYLLLRFQAWLPLNPAGQSAVAPDLSLNTAISFATNTSWQSYGGGGHLRGRRADPRFRSPRIRNDRQFLGRFDAGDTLSAAAHPRAGDADPGLARCTAEFLGADRRDNAGGGDAGHLARPGRVAGGREAAQRRWRGFFNAQSAHPFENPTAWTNLLGMLLMPLIGAALTNFFGRVVGDERQGWALLAAMLVLLLVGVVTLHAVESGGNPLFAAAGLDQAAGNLEGKEVRFGVPASALFAELATTTSSGTVNAMHDSFMPLSSLVLMGNMMLDEVIIGGPGSGLFGMLLFTIV